MSEHKPPVAGKIPYQSETHGHSRTDDYHWLREKEQPEVISYLEEENSYTANMTAHTAELQEQLYNEMLGRIQQTDLKVPFRWGDYWYYSRTVEGKQYAIYCRRKGSMEGEEEILLDLNEEAEKARSDYLGIGVYKISPDHSLLAYSLDLNGSEEYTVRVRDLESGKDLDDMITGTNYSLEWAADGRTFFYAIHDEAKRAHKILRHRLGDGVEKDREVFHEPDERFSVHVSKTADRTYLVLSTQSKETSEEYVLSAADPEGSFRLVAPREPKMEYSIEHRNGFLYILTNEHAPNFRLMRTPVADTNRANWEELIPGRENVMLNYIVMFSDHLVIHKRTRGLTGIDIFHFGSGDWTDVEFDEEVYTVFTRDNVEFDSDVLRFSYTSLTTPESIYDYDMRSGERTLDRAVKRS